MTRVLPPFNPTDAEWYLADLVLEIVVEGDPRNVVHVNSVLVQASSSDEAYEKAMILGRNSEKSYTNPVGNNVTFSFRGLQGLYVIHEELEHGAEIIYTQRVGLTPQEISGLIVPREKLAVFAPRESHRDSGVPDYRSGDIVRELEEMGFDPDED